MNTAAALPRTLVVNFNSPELNQLALALARAQVLAAYVRPYVNKGRAWERALEAMPLAGSVYGSTFGRRRISDPALASLTREAGVLFDLCAAAIGRLGMLAPHLRHRWTNRLYMEVREAVARKACPYTGDAACVVAYEGFALPAFQAATSAGQRGLVLNYPVAHHRERRRIRLEENEREPEFAVTWPDFDDWAPGHEERLDAEIEQADAILVGSTFAADSFVAQGVARSKMKMIPYGVDLQVFSPGPPRGASAHFNVIYAGQLTQRKGLSYLLRGYRRFARRDTRLTLVGSIVGGDEPLRPYRDSIEHIPHQTRPALAARYRASDVFVLPTLVEGMGLVVLEAMACGVPVIVTANGPGDIVRDGIDGFIVPERDEEAICRCLERLYLNPELRAQMGRQAALRAREFDWLAYTSKVGQVLRELANHAPVGAAQPAYA
ncbi:MAG: glycosyltransferase family 4 protein [Cytophagales bacterium]|nr:glycosyltransferase family 4 protein [Rhizobacter sp.]